MKFQIISVKLGKDAEKILKAYPILKDKPYKVVENELEVTVNELEDLMLLIKGIKQNCFICHDENVIHIYDAKLR